MSQLHHEGLRKQIVADKRTAAADMSWLLQKAGSSQGQRNSSSGLRSVHSTPTGHSSHSGNFAVRGAQSSGSRSKEVVITDPYLDAITKETRARNTKRFTSADYFMQW